MSSTELQRGLGSLEFSRFMFSRLLDATPEDHWFHIPIADGNHAAWLAGHVAWEDDDCLKQLQPERGSRLPPSWHATFATGTQPVGDGEAYPPIDELRAQLKTLRDELNQFFQAEPDEIEAPIPKGLHGFAKDRAALMHAIACHEMIHVGHLTVVRKSLQLGPVFM